MAESSVQPVGTLTCELLATPDRKCFNPFGATSIWLTLALRTVHRLSQKLETSYVTVI
jgi:hypothetical protein